MSELDLVSLEISLSNLEKLVAEAPTWDLGTVYWTARVRLTNAYACLRDPEDFNNPNKIAIKQLIETVEILSDPKLHKD